MTDYNELRDYEDYMRHEDRYVDEDYEPHEPQSNSVYRIAGDSVNGYNIHWWTNDDQDLGYPTDIASDDYNGFETLEKALRFTGGITRQGIGCLVKVYLNGKLL